MTARAALLVPCRNGAPFLPRLAESARAQTRPFDDWWLCDDASTDGSAEIARELGFQVLRSGSVRGPAAARNALADATTCDWLHFHDADDLMAPDYLSASLEAAGEDADLVICDMPWVDEHTREAVFHWRYDAAALRQAPAAALIQQTVGGINALYRQSFFRQAGGFDARRAYWEDLELALRLVRAGARIRVVNRDLVTALRRGDSYSNRAGREVWVAKLALMEEWLGIDRAGVATVVAREAEAIAVRMIGLGEREAAARALALAVRAGGSPPSTGNPLLRGAKRFLSPMACLRLQQWGRRRTAGLLPRPVRR